MNEVRTQRILRSDTNAGGPIRSIKIVCDTIVLTDEEEGFVVFSFKDNAGAKAVSRVSAAGDLSKYSGAIILDADAEIDGELVRRVLFRTTAGMLTIDVGWAEVEQIQGNE